MRYRTPLLATALIAAGLAGCQNSANMKAEQAMLGGNVRYNESGQMLRLYEYYPNAQVYRSVHRYTWCWQDDMGVWRMGSELPESIAMNLGMQYEFVELPTARPFDFHDQVAATYPTNQELAERLARMESEMVIGAFASVPND